MATLLSYFPSLVREDALCSLIGVEVRNVFFRVEKVIEVRFGDGHIVVIGCAEGTHGEWLHYVPSEGKPVDFY